MPYKLIFKDKKRYIWVYLCVLSCSLTTFGCTFEPRDAQVGHYSIPLIQGWDHKNFNSDYLQSTTQNTTVGASIVSVKFVCFSAPPNTQTSSTASDLKNEAALEEQSMKDLSSSSDFESRTITSEATQYKTWPAFVTERQNFQHGRVTIVRILRFTDGHNLYTFQSNIGGVSIDPQAKIVADQAWVVLTDGLRPAPAYNVWVLAGGIVVFIGVVTLAVLVKRKSLLKNKSA